LPSPPAHPQRRHCSAGSRCSAQGSASPPSRRPPAAPPRSRAPTKASLPACWRQVRSSDRARPRGHRAARRSAYRGARRRSAGAGRGLSAGLRPRSSARRRHGRRRRGEGSAIRVGVHSASGYALLVTRVDERSDATPFLPECRSLKALREAAADCRGCHLHERATQTVFGEGLKRARLAMVGEIPGDREDRVGRVFVGPARRQLDKALEAVGIVRAHVYISNVVKHFKFQERGKRRITRGRRSSRSTHAFRGCARS
jgi:Uracil DNA glycosylase superfamily